MSTFCVTALYLCAYTNINPFIELVWSDGYDTIYGTPTVTTPSDRIWRFNDCISIDGISQITPTVYAENATLSQIYVDFQRDPLQVDTNGNFTRSYNEATDQQRSYRNGVVQESNCNEYIEYTVSIYVPTTTPAPTTSAGCESPRCICVTELYLCAYTPILPFIEMVYNGINWDDWRPFYGTSTVTTATDRIWIFHDCIAIDGFSAITASVYVENATVSQIFVDFQRNPIQIDSDGNFTLEYDRLTDVQRGYGNGAIPRSNCNEYIKYTISSAPTPRPTEANDTYSIETSETSIEETSIEETSSEETSIDVPEVNYPNHSNYVRPCIFSVLYIVLNNYF